MLLIALIRSPIAQSDVEISKFEGEELKIKTDKKSIFLKNSYLDENSRSGPKINRMTTHFEWVTRSNYKIGNKKFSLSDLCTVEGRSSQKVTLNIYYFLL